MLKSVASASVITPSDKLRLILLVLIGATAILDLARAKHIVYILGTSGFVGLGRSPTMEESYTLVVLGVLLACLFVLLGCGAVLNHSRTGYPLHTANEVGYKPCLLIHER